MGLLDSEEEVRGFVSRHRLTFSNIYDAEGRIAKAYGFTYQPYWAVIDRSGALVHSGFGPSSEDELRKRLRDLVK